MRIDRTAGVLAALLPLVAACSQGSDAGNQSSPQSADQLAGSEANQMAGDRSNPYAGAETQMHERMMAAVGIDVSDTWVRKMIAHHQGAVDMSNIFLAEASDGPMVDMARKTVAMQKKEIADLQKLRRDGSPSQQSAALFSPGMMQMSDRMMTAKGADAAETWARKMIEHHRGAVEMAKLVLANGAAGEVREMAQKTVREQTKDISDLEKLLRGENPMASDAKAGSSGNGTASVTKSPPSGAPADKGPAASKGTGTAPAADQHTGHDMENMQH